MIIKGKFVAQPSLSELFDFYGSDLASKLRVCSTGEIATYDPVTRTASVKIGEPLVLNNGTVLPILHPIPNVPVVSLQGGGVHLSFPIFPGDECLVIFNDFNIDAWFTSGGQQVPPSARQHDLSDGFAIVGPNSLANKLVSALLEFEGGLATETAKVAINANTDQITIANSDATLLQVLTKILAAISDTNTPPGNTALEQLTAAVTTLTVAVTALNTAIAGESSVIPTAAAVALAQEPTLATLATTIATLAGVISAQSAASTADATDASLAAGELLY